MARPELIKRGAFCERLSSPRGRLFVAFPRVAKADQDNIVSSGPECGDEAGWVVPSSRDAPETTSIVPSRWPHKVARRLISQPPLFFTFRHPRCVGTGKPRLARELSKKRRRSEVSVPHSGSAGAVGRHNQSRIGPRSAGASKHPLPYARRHSRAPNAT
jgi:hypothetical protein